MTEQHIFQQGLDLLIFGMGSVFFFLALLVCVTVIMSSIINRYFLDDEPTQSPSITQQASPNLVSILQAAIDQHRSR